MASDATYELTDFGGSRGGILVAAIVLSCACNAMESRTSIDVEALGPQVGEQVPAFGLPDQHGRVVTLDSVLGPNGAILMFHRSADW